jgi:hypothetical protein
MQEEAAAVKLEQLKAQDRELEGGRLENIETFCERVLGKIRKDDGKEDM